MKVPWRHRLHRLMFRLRRALRRPRGPYGGCSFERWETPVVNVQRLLMVSLTDQDRKLVAVFEAPWDSARPRWQVRFERVAAYRVADELHLGALFRRFHAKGERAESSFTVLDSPWLLELVEMRPLRHYVIATLDDVLEVAAEVEPRWEELAPAPPGAPFPGKKEHFFWPEDREAVLGLMEDVQERQPRADA